jgi:hypothetical protein
MPRLPTTSITAASVSPADALAKQAGVERFPLASSCRNYSLTGDEIIETGELKRVTGYTFQRSQLASRISRTRRPQPDPPPLTG